MSCLKIKTWIGERWARWEARESARMAEIEAARHAICARCAAPITRHDTYAGNGKWNHTWKHDRSNSPICGAPAVAIPMGHEDAK